MVNNKLINLNRGRQSNIEALRLISMLMVLNLHSFWGYSHGSGLLQVADFFRESTSICAVNAFLLISGYFGIKWKFKSFFNLIFQLFFYAFGVYAVAVALGIIDFSVRDFLMNFTCIYKYWGFITAYVLLYVLSPMLNALAEKLTSKELLATILLLYISEWFITRDCGSLNYGIIYLIGRFMKKTDAVEKLKVYATSAYWITTIIIFVLVYCSYRFLHIRTDGRVSFRTQLLKSIRHLAGIVHLPSVCTNEFHQQVYQLVFCILPFDILDSHASCYQTDRIL